MSDIAPRPDVCDEYHDLKEALAKAEELHELLRKIESSPILTREARMDISRLVIRVGDIVQVKAPIESFPYQRSLPGLVERAACHGKESGLL